MRRGELVSPEGLRQDGRRPAELRRVQATLGCVSTADGSALLTMGNTRVMATVTGPHETSNSATAHGLVRVQFHAAAFSSTAGDRRRVKQDRRSEEWSVWLEGILNSSLMLETFAGSQLDIFIDVLDADGGI